MGIERMDGESDWTWTKRIAFSKLDKDVKEDWNALAKMLHRSSGESLRHDAYAWKEMDENENGIGVHRSILSISDLHVPFQLDYHILESYKGVDILQINGDIQDNQAISKFPKPYRVSPMEEMIQTRQYLIDMINFLEPKKVVINYGNHDLRFAAYLARSLDSDLLELHPDTNIESIVEDGFRWFNKREGTKTEYRALKDVLDVDIEFVHNWYCQIGDTVFAHPKAFKSGIMKTAESAMNWFRNENYDFNKLVMAHTHRSGQYTIGKTTIYEQGCFCDVTKINYSDGLLQNSQKEGFIYLCQDKDGKTIDSMTKLVVLN